MERKILALMKENGIALFAEADRATGAVHIEKPGDLESWTRRCAGFIRNMNVSLDDVFQVHQIQRTVNSFAAE